MAGIATRIDPGLRQRMLSEMGIEPLRSKPNQVVGGGMRCLILVSAAERDGGSCERLLQRILAAAGLPEQSCTQLWMQPGTSASGLPAHSCCLVLGSAVSGLSGQTARYLPSLQELLDGAAGKRQVWQALTGLRQQLRAEG